MAENFPSIVELSSQRSCTPSATSKQEKSIPTHIVPDYSVFARWFFPGVVKAVLRGQGLHEHSIPKRDGTTREILIGNEELTEWVKQFLLPPLVLLALRHGFVDSMSHGFIPGRSPQTAAQRVSKWHEARGDKRYGLVSYDLKSAFPSVPEKRVREALRALGLSGFTLHFATKSCVHKGYLAQGTPLAPLVLVIATKELRERLRRVSRQYGGTVSQYADDITITAGTTSIKKLHGLRRWVAREIRQSGFTPHPRKFAVRAIGVHPDQVGEVVGVKVHSRSNFRVPQRTKKKLRAMQHQMLQGRCECNSCSGLQFLQDTTCVRNVRDGLVAYSHHTGKTSGAWLGRNPADGLPEARLISQDDFPVGRFYKDPAETRREKAALKKRLSEADHSCQQIGICICSLL